MSSHRFVLWFALPLFLVATVSAAAPAEAPAPRSPWPELRREHKPWTRWWWLGSAVDPENLTRELEAIAAAGFGGVEITPIYGAKGYEERFIPYLSPKYLEMLAHTASEARRLGLAVDMATGTGWPFGGAQVRTDDAELKIELKDGRLAPRPTGFRVKRAAPGAEGLVLDPYSADALRRYLQPFDAAFAMLPAGTIHSQFHDSFEYTANWSRELPARFRLMHGYELADHVAELGGNGEPDTVARIKADYRATLAALHLDYVQAWVDWCHQHGQAARNQAHGAPGNLLDLYALADIPETEVFGANAFPIPGFRREPETLSKNRPQPLVNRFASSAAHVAGRPLASSETFTWLREHFQEAPAQMKPELDLLFLTGINHVFYHGTAYSPADAPWPGWLFYASTQLNPRNPLWRDFGDGLNAYIARAQSLLQAGQPDNDLLVYWPIHDLYHQAEGWERRFSMHGSDWLTDTAVGTLAQTLVDRGFSFDFVSDAQLERATFDGHRVRTAGNGAYWNVIVPPTAHMPVATLQRLLALAADGAGIIFLDRLPGDVPGLGRLEERRAAFRAALASLDFAEAGEDGIRKAHVGKGLVAVAPAANYLAASALLREPLVDAGLQFIRRRLEEGTLYFVTNLSGRGFEGWLRLRDPLYSPGLQSILLLDPRNGAYGLAAMRSHDGPEVLLQLQPGESVFLKTYETAPAAAGDFPAWTYTRPAGAAVPLAGEWRVTFRSGGPGLPPAFATRELASWTARGGEAERFAGTARYESSFELPADIDADDWRLDLGEVRETARVFVNGAEVDLLWSVPFSVRIGAHLKPGSNTIAVEVTNLAANRIRDLDRRGVAWKNFHEINFVNVHYQRFDASTWALTPSGLLGPVTLTPLRRMAR
ncbi:MAG TPA: glycosyl hydrolase [Opitutaceae bacterium]